MKQRILLLDDDPGVRRMLRRVLEDDDYTVTCASSGKEAIQKAASEEIALVLLDLNLPDENGWQVLERLNSGYPAIPVIVITARSNQIFPALASGVGALMEKPLDLAKLLRTIEELLAEPAEARHAKLAGHAAEFHYLPPKV
jgi:CheY-like chemotaxis protein